MIESHPTNQGDVSGLQHMGVLQGGDQMHVSTELQMILSGHRPLINEPKKHNYKFDL